METVAGVLLALSWIVSLVASFAIGVASGLSMAGKAKQAFIKQCETSFLSIRNQITGEKPCKNKS